MCVVGAERTATEALPLNTFVFAPPESSGLTLKPAIRTLEKASAYA